jgi:hypothetical protein
MLIKGLFNCCDQLGTYKKLKELKHGLAIKVKVLTQSYKSFKSIIQAPFYINLG